jgi:urease accessory protein UreE
MSVTANHSSVVHTAAVTWPSFSYTPPSYSSTAHTLGAQHLTAQSVDATVTTTDNTLQPFITCYMWKRTA